RGCVRVVVQRGDRVLDPGDGGGGDAGRAVEDAGYRRLGHPGVLGDVSARDHPTILSPLRGRCGRVCIRIHSGYPTTPERFVEGEIMTAVQSTVLKARTQTEVQRSADPTVQQAVADVI